MIDVIETAEFAASADTVWSFIGDFNGLPRYVPAVTASRQVGDGLGAQRHIQVAGTDGETIETLEAYDPVARKLSYSVQQSSLRMHDYYATIQVDALDPSSCRLTWKCQFRPVDGDDGSETAGFIRDSYVGAMGRLAEKVRS